MNRVLVDDRLAARFITLQENAKTWREPIGFKEQREPRSIVLTTTFTF